MQIVAWLFGSKSKDVRLTTGQKKLFRAPQSTDTIPLPDEYNILLREYKCDKCGVIQPISNMDFPHRWELECGECGEVFKEITPENISHWYLAIADAEETLKMLNRHGWDVECLNT